MYDRWTDESTEGHNLFSASSICGHEDPKYPGWRCLKEPGERHEDRPHVYGNGIQLGTVTRGPASKSPASDRE